MLPLSCRQRSLLLLVLSAVFLASGCATTKYDYKYRIDGQEYGDFKNLSDEAALKAVVMTYNVKTESADELIAKTLTLQTQMDMLAKRKSAYIRSSGVFEQIKFDRLDLKTWTDDELILAYNTLKEKTILSYDKPSDTLTEQENARRIVYMAGMQVIVNELEKRENTKQAWAVAAQLLSTALTVAVSMI
jgi:hypothetical protein